MISQNRSHKPSNYEHPRNSNKQSKSSLLRRKTMHSPFSLATKRSSRSQKLRKIFCGDSSNNTSTHKTSSTSKEPTSINNSGSRHQVHLPNSRVILDTIKFSRGKLSTILRQTSIRSKSTQSGLTSTLKMPRSASRWKNDSALYCFAS